MGRKALAVLRDLAVALAIGLAIGLAAGVVLWAVGALAGGVFNGFVVARSGLMVVGGLLLIFSAILLLKGGSLPEDAFRLFPWRRRERLDDMPELPKVFWVVDRRYTFLLMAVGILLVSSIPDRVVFYGAI